MAKSAVSVNGIVKRFGNHVAVDGLSFEVPRGCVYGILGPNGAGKTTTLRMVNDVIAPDAGTIAILDGLKPGSESARHIGYLPEERGLYPKMRVLDMIAFMGELRGLSKSDARQRATRGSTPATARWTTCSRWPNAARRRRPLHGTSLRRGYCVTGAERKILSKSVRNLSGW
jgi:ABC-type Fe3+/spermidine/putrescine transport system ATPase subunit